MSSLTDEVWTTLQPHAGRLTGRGRRLLVLTALVLAGVTGLAHLVAVSGLITPRLRADYGWGPSSYRYGDAESSFVFNAGSTPSRRVSFTFGLSNDGSRAVEIVGIGESPSGLRLEAVRVGETHQVSENRWTTGGRDLVAGEPYLLLPDEILKVELEYEVVDCAAVPAGPRAIPVRATGLRGEQVVELTLPAASFRVGGWRTMADPADPAAVHWPEHLADAACRLPRG
ncbi:hypothetical protein [Micromonospora sp. NPDC049891]|uniref:hypothetical protein n=1 Tax=Micromonospora sp. NPDC049891 TaxID=3155655 RepID=UPI0033E84341